LVGQQAVVSFSRAVNLVYDTANTSLTTAQRQSLVELVLATAEQSATPGVVHDVKAVVWPRVPCLPISKLSIACAVQIAEQAPAFIINQYALSFCMCAAHPLSLLLLGWSS